MAATPRKLAPSDFGHAAASYHVRPEYLPHQIAEVLQTHGTPKDAIIVDVGSGTSKLSKMFSGQCGEIYCVDLKPEMIAKGRQTMADFVGKANFIEADYKNTGVTSGVADLIVVGDAAHWFEDTAAAITEFRRISKASMKIAVFARQPDSDSPIVQKLHALLLEHDKEYQKPDANWVVKNDADIDRKQGEHLVDGSKRFSELMVMSWSKQDLLDYLKSRSSGKWAEEHPQQEMDLVVSPLFAAFPDQVQDGRIAFPYQSGVLIGTLKKQEQVIEGGLEQIRDVRQKGESR